MELLKNKIFFTFLYVALFGAVLNFAFGIDVFNFKRLLKAKGMGSPTDPGHTESGFVNIEDEIHKKIKNIENKPEKKKSVEKNLKPVTKDKKNVVLKNKNFKVVKPKNNEPVGFKVEHQELLINNCIKGTDDKCYAQALDYFFKKLMKTESKKEKYITRIFHYGDSVIAGDSIVGYLRKKFQQRFGDAGPGYIFIVNPWSWYYKSDVVISSYGKWFEKYMHFGKFKDKFYGISGMIFIPAGTGVKTKIKIKNWDKPNKYDLTIYYLKDKNYGKFEIGLNGKKYAILDTSAQKPGVGFFNIKLENQPFTSLSIKSLDSKAKALSGIMAEKGENGVVWNNFGIISETFLSFLNTDFSRLKQTFFGKGAKKPDLVIFQFGINSGMNNYISEEIYEKKVNKVMKNFKSILKNVSCLIISPYDLPKTEDGSFKTRRSIKIIVRVQKRIAKKYKCAFFDAFMAMGGKGSFMKWYKNSPRLAGGDFKHLTKRGANLMAKMILKSLEVEYDRFKKRFTKK